MMISADILEGAAIESTVSKTSLSVAQAESKIAKSKTLIDFIIFIFI